MRAPIEGEAGTLALRAGSLADLEVLLALEHRVFAADRLSRRAVRRFLKQPHLPVTVARFGAQFAGFAVVALRRGAKSARLYSIAVDPAFRRRGVGRELLSAAERYARAHGCERLRLEVRYDNAPGIALYRKHGYREFGRHPAYYEDGAEATRFEKRLD